MFETILLAVDGSPYAQRAAELVRRLAAGGDDVIVLHVTEIMPMHRGINVDWDREGLEAARRFGPGHHKRSTQRSPGGKPRQGRRPPGVPPRPTANLVAHHHGDHVAPHGLVEPGPRSTAAQAAEGESAS
jgi:hypothetical protein